MSWQDLLSAARRKLEVSEYHLECLKPTLRAPSASTERPPVPVQAHFEGVVVSVLAAIDQVAQAVNSRCDLRLAPGDLAAQSFARAAQLVPEVAGWFSEPIGRDLRRIRRLMVHYSYRKLPSGSDWLVEPAGTDFSGSRELVAYAQQAVHYGQELSRLLPQLEQSLSEL